MTCARHENCTFTGDERGRCQACHRLWTVICGRDEALSAKHERRPMRSAGRVRGAHIREHMKADLVRERRARARRPM